MARLGRAQSFAPFQFGAIAEGADVTVALAGQAITSALGTLVPALSKALSGEVVTSASGTLSHALAMALNGSVITISQGNLRVEGLATGDPDKYWLSTRLGLGL